MSDLRTEVLELAAVLRESLGAGKSAAENVGNLRWEVEHGLAGLRRVDREVAELVRRLDAAERRRPAPPPPTAGGALERVREALLAFALEELPARLGVAS